jgi:uncharacterized protein
MLLLTLTARALQKLLFLFYFFHLSNAMNSTQPRIYVVDALRGFALVSIMLIHNLEHFDYYYTPEGLPDWMLSIDKGVWETVFFLFAGKSYAIFAFLFGLTFFIQSNNQEQKGEDFRPRFAWRLILLFLFALANGAFYQGDILMTYAIVGFGLIPVARLSDKAVLLIALFFMAQPYELYNMIQGILYPVEKLPDPASWAYFGKMNDYIPKKSFIDTVIGNLTNGRTAVALWTWENGRVFQALSLFMLGMLAGRKKLFDLSLSSKSFWLKTLFISGTVFIPLFILSKILEKLTMAESIRRPLLTIEVSWSNMAFMLVLVSGIILLYYSSFFQSILNKFAPIGRMSLSNYIIQSVVGSFVYYGFGLGLYYYTGATYSLCIGICLAIFQGYFSNWWMKEHKQGPLEAFWHRATWMKTN